MIKNYIGQKHGLLTVTNQKSDELKGTILEVVCECGNIKEISTSNFRRAKSCGCSRKSIKRIDKNTVIEIGDVFGRLTIVKQLDTIEYKKRFLCRCGCGRETIYTMSNLINGNIKDCPCMYDGLSKHRLYGVWKDMMRRCYNSSDSTYKYYGGRGITVCDEWASDAKNFYKDMDDLYIDGLQLDRIDNNGNYCKSNCKWSTREEQMNNRSNNIILFKNGVRITVKELSKIFNMSAGSILYRIEKYGNSIFELDNE